MVAIGVGKSGKMLRPMVLPLLAATVVGCMGGVVCMYVLHRRPDDTKRVLIKRLANATPHNVTFGGAVLLYRSEPDEGVYDEILSRGREMVPYLIEGLRDSNLSIRAHCANLLCLIPSRQGVKALIDSIAEESGRGPPLDTIQSALHRLTGDGSLQPPGSMDNPDVSAMIRFWETWWRNNHDRLVETESGIALVDVSGLLVSLPLKPGELSGSNYSDWGNLRDPNPVQREAAVRLLGERGKPDAIPALIGALQDEAWLVRRAAAVALGRIGNTDAMPALERTAQDENALVRAAAIAAIEEIRNSGDN